MMLTIHGLPMSVKYHELKALIKEKCNINDFILDNLVSEDSGTKKVRIGVADENEGSVLMRCLDGYTMNGYRIKIQPVGKTPLLNTPKQMNYDSRPNYEPRPDYGHQPYDQNTPNRQLYPPVPARPTNNYPYIQHGEMPQQSKMDMGMYPQREVYIHSNRPQEPNYVYPQKPNVPMVNEERRVVEIRPHILRTVELDRGTLVKPYQPSPQPYVPPQQKPVTIFKDNFQGPTQGYVFNQMNQPMQPQPYQGGQDVMRTVWPPEQNKQHLGYAKPNPPFYDKPAYNEERKFPQHPSAENPQVRGLLKTPTNYVSPKYSNIPQTTHVSPMRKASPLRRSSPGRRMSPQGRQDLRKPSPGRRLSPGQRLSPGRRMSPGHRQSPMRSPSGNRRLLSPPPRKASPTRISPSRRQYYEGSEKYDNRASHSTPKVRSGYDGQTAPNQYSGGYGPGSSQDRSQSSIKATAAWQDTKRYPDEFPKEGKAIRRGQENMYQHFDIPSVKEVQRSVLSAPPRRSRSPVRRVSRSPLRGSPRKQSPPRRQWHQERQERHDERGPPSPPSWPRRYSDDRQQSTTIVWEKNNDGPRQRDYRPSSGDVDFGPRDKYEDRPNFPRGEAADKYRRHHEEPSKPPGHHRHQEHQPRQEDEYGQQEVRGRQERDDRAHYPKRSDQPFDKRNETFVKNPDPFQKHPKTFDKSPQHLYGEDRKREVDSREQFRDRRGDYSERPDELQKQRHRHHEEAFPKRQAPPRVVYEEPPVAKRHESSFVRPPTPKQYQKHREPFPSRQDQHADRRDDYHKFGENRNRTAEQHNIIVEKKPNIGNVEGRGSSQQSKPNELDDLTKRAQQWAQGVGGSSNSKVFHSKMEETTSPQVQQKAINIITRKILARHNVKMKEERQKKISICLRKMIEKRVNDIVRERNANLFEIQHLFRLNYSIQDEEKMYVDAVAAYPLKRRNDEESGGPLQKLAKMDDQKQGKSESYSEKPAKSTRWMNDAEDDGVLHAVTDSRGSVNESNENSVQVYSLYLCKDDFSIITDAEANFIREFLVSKVFDATADLRTSGPGWAPNFTIRGLQSLCRYEIETTDKASMVWLESFHFSLPNGTDIVAYTKEELWYERADIWLPGHTRHKNIEPLDKLRYQNRHLTDVAIGKWKLVKKVVMSTGTKIYVDMPPSSARALEAYDMKLSYELQKVYVFLKAIAVDKEAFDAGLRERSITDKAELTTAFLNTPIPMVKNSPRLIKICFKPRMPLNVEQAKKVKEMIIYCLYKYHKSTRDDECSRTDFLEYGFCPPGYFGVLPENEESALWLRRQTLLKLKNQQLVFYDSEKEDNTNIRMNVYFQLTNQTRSSTSILNILAHSNQNVENLNIKNWEVVAFQTLKIKNKDSAKLVVEMDIHSAKALLRNDFQLKFQSYKVAFTHNYEDIRAVIKKIESELTDSYDITNMELASVDDM